MNSPLRLWTPNRRSAWGSDAPLDPARCPVMVSDHDTRISRFSQCSRKPAGLTRPLNDGIEREVCKLHARQYDQKDEREKKWDRDRERGRAIQARVEKLPIQASVERGSGVVATGRVIVSLDELEKLLARKPGEGA